MTLVNFKEKNVSICILRVSLEGQEENWLKWDKSGWNFCIAAPINPAVLAAYSIYPLKHGCWAPYGPLIQDTSLLQGQFQRSTALNHHCPCLSGLGYSGHLLTAEPSCRASIYFLFLGFTHHLPDSILRPHPCLLHLQHLCCFYRRCSFSANHVSTS